jgi:hypothetical protein
LVGLLWLFGILGLLEPWRVDTVAEWKSEGKERSMSKQCANAANSEWINQINHNCVCLKLTHTNGNLMTKVSITNDSANDRDFLICEKPSTQF